MARQESQSKLLYYPTDEPVVRLLATWLSNPYHSRLADPCVGKGEALRLLADLLGGDPETWGVELSYSRAEAARQVIDVVLPDSFYNVKWADKTISLALNNPPYDWSSRRTPEGKYIRHERLFIVDTTRKLVAGGVHLIIIPRSQLLDEEIARHITGWYERILVFGYPDSQFNQVIVIGQKRARHKPPAKVQIKSLRAWGQPEVQLTPLCEGDGRYVIPAAPSVKSNAFLYRLTSYQAIVKAAAQCSPLDTKEWQQRTHVRSVGAPCSALVPEKIGFLAMKLSSGEMGVLPIEIDGEVCLTKGQLRKETTQTREAKFNQDGEHYADSVEEKERMATVITTVRPTGEIRIISTSSQVGDFITRHAQALAEAVQERDIPLYQFQPSIEDWAAARTVGSKMPPLPGRSERGLFEIQAHSALAISLGMSRRTDILTNADMGWGKTLTSIAAMTSLDKWPVIAMVPGHVVEKWQRDIERGSSPDRPITARIIDKGAMPAADPIAKARQIGARVTNDERRGSRRILTIESTESQKRTIENYCRSRHLEPFSYLDLLPADKGSEENPVYIWGINILNTSAASYYHNIVLPIVEKHLGVVIERERLQLKGNTHRQRLTIEIARHNEYGLRHTLADRRLHPEVKSRTKGHVVLEIDDRDPYTLPQFVADYEAGRLGERAVAIVAFEPAKNDAGADRNHPAVLTVHRRKWNEEKRAHEIVQVKLCPECGGEVDDKMLKKGRCQCGSALFNFSRWRRVAVSRLVRDKYRHFFKAYLMDEMHKAQAGDTDIGAADGRFVSSTKYSLELTGTLFGGYSSSLFYLLYRRVQAVRQIFSYRDLSAWVHTYGLLKYNYTEKPMRETGQGATSGVRRWDYRETEIPGVSPAIVQFLLPQTLFARITDLGYQLPPKQEIIHRVDMDGGSTLLTTGGSTSLTTGGSTSLATNGLGAQYDHVHQTLWNIAKSHFIERKDKRYFSIWAAHTLRRPNAAFREETIHGLEDDPETGEREVLMRLSPVVGDPPDALPKEERLAEIVATAIGRLGKHSGWPEDAGVRRADRHARHPGAHQEHPGDVGAYRQGWRAQNQRQDDACEPAGPRAVDREARAQPGCADCQSQAGRNRAGPDPIQRDRVLRAEL